MAELVKTPFLKTNVGKTLVAAAYIAVSAVLGFLVTAVQGQPELFGVYTPFINVVLVFLAKTFADKNTKNV